MKMENGLGLLTRVVTERQRLRGNKKSFFLIV
jgi:hypothetical protein